MENIAVQVNNLIKTFGDITAVNDVSFEIKKNTIFGFLGPNGAGKTTTINILCTLLKPTSGIAKINDYNCVENPDEVRQSIGIVFQDPSLDERLSAWDNLEFHGLVYNIGKQERRKRIDFVLDMVELTNRKKNIVRTFSGGMKRRLEIARGLMHQPTVLFLDEPTLGLDPQTRNYIWNYIRKLKDEHSITIFLTTHYMDEAENCDEIAIIDKGRIIALDTPKNLKKSVAKNKITLITEDNKKASSQINNIFNIKTNIQNNSLDVEVDDAEKFIPKLIKNITVPIDTIKLFKPSLDDVFLNLTGKHIRDESISRKDQTKEMGRYRRRRK